MAKRTASGDEILGITLCQSGEQSNIVTLGRGVLESTTL